MEQQRPGQESPELTALRKRTATAQLASQVFHNLVIERADSITEEPEVIVERAFKLAEAFDRKLEDYLMPPKIQLATELPK